MSRTTIRVEHLAKRYRLGGPSGQDRLSEVAYGLGRLALSRPRRWLGLAPPEPPDKAAGRGGEFWALQDVSFDVAEGEVVGVVGRNGAGKSTLLKILSGITEPTSGRFGMRGRVSTLLEAGTGFHPELTGRENVFLGGAMLGMSRDQVRRKFDAIVDFSEIGQFLDTPVKRYSSGMYVRLAFAVAAHLEPEVLIVDEVLAVGDAAFQRKCMTRMNDLARGRTTILFVSHSTAAVASFCQRVVWLEKGRVREVGEVSGVLNRYLDLELGKKDVTARDWPDEGQAPGTDELQLRHAAVAPAEGEGPLTVRTPLRFAFEVLNRSPGGRMNFALLISEAERGLIFRSPSEWREWPRGVVRGEVLVPGGLLNDGFYSARVVVTAGGRTVPVIDVDNALTFHLHDAEQHEDTARWPGAVRPALPWRIDAAPSA